MTISRVKDISADLAYIKALFIDSDAPEEKIFASLTSQQAVMQLSSIEASILQLLVAISGAKHIVEIGVLAGYSAIKMANILPQDGHIHAVERDEGCIAMARQHAKDCGVEQKITFYHGEALTVLKTLEHKAPFDLVFIDADKGRYVEYLHWSEQHLKPGGIIIGDNTLLFGHVYQEKCPEGVSKKSYDAMREFNRILANQERFISIMLPTVEGMVIAKKKG